MKKGVVIFTLFSTVLVYGQRPNPKLGSLHRIDSKKPTLYLSFKETTKATEEIEEGYRLRFHNNTRWGILCYLVPEKSLPGDYSLFYKVEDREGNMIFNRARGHHVIFMHRIKPRTSISFVVPKKQLIKGQEVYVTIGAKYFGT
ncbi:MAG: hypothetical protein JST84_20985 [Acidobacteria bacterium]|nr:hypothetical protein [Acidobacteriota bacterium]